MIISDKRGYIALAAMAALVSLTLGVLIKSGTVSVCVQDDKSNEEIPLVAVMYHAFSSDISKCGKYIIPPDLFESDVKYLLDNGYTFVDTGDILSYYKDGTDLPEKPVMITIDDGHYSNYAYIFPIMKKYTVKAVISPIAIESDRYSQSMDLNPAYANMCWDNIKEMHSTGLADIQNHSYDMHKINKSVRGCAPLLGEDIGTYRKRLYDDLKKADDAIFGATGERPVCMVYPFGLTSKEARDVIDKLGYSMSVSCTEGITMLNRETDCLHMIKRYNRPYGKSSQDFFKKIESAGNAR